MDTKEQNAKEKISISALLYMLYTASYFLHLPARIDFLAVIRFDMLVAILLICVIFFNYFSVKKKPHNDPISKSLYLLIFYIIISLPFVEWPGSVIKQNFYFFLKAILFFFFTIHTIKNIRELKFFLFIFISCQIFRVLEPLWLHLTTGYWGSATYIGTGFSDRLAGSPHDIINPNGLAFIIVLLIPLLHFTSKGSGFLYKSFYLIITPLLIYALILSQSRSGLIALSIVLLYIFIKSNKKFILLTLLILSSILIWTNLDTTYKNRYMSINILNQDVSGHSSAQGRIDGWISGFKVFMNKPLFGHGLGTSLEAGWNTVGHAQIAHNMYIEVLQELGFLGFIFALLFWKNILISFQHVRSSINYINQNNKMLTNLCYALESISVMLIIFSFASYGLSTYTWYFFGGLSSVILRLSKT